MKKSWVVQVRAVVMKEVICDNCAEDQARRNRCDTRYIEAIEAL